MVSAAEIPQTVMVPVPVSNSSTCCDDMDDPLKYIQTTNILWRPAADQRSMKEKSGIDLRNASTALLVCDSLVTLLLVLLFVDLLGE